MVRDLFTCQYCGKKLSKNKLNLDHVVPRSRGGKSTWENVVTSCHVCNRRKGGHMPEEVRMTPLRKPYKPNAVALFSREKGKVTFEEWAPFLNLVDFSYWNVELEE